MPRRKIKLATGEFYHVFNRSLHRIPVFSRRKAANNFLEAARYYIFANRNVKFSHYKVQKKLQKAKESKPFFSKNLPQLVRILAYTIMPNHFHFLLRQEKEGGIQTFMQKLSNSFSHYYNTVNNSRGPVFEGTFEAVRIETEKQLLHVSRYIHLNAVTAHLVDEPRNYEFSSYGLYVSQERANKNSWIDTSIIMSYFKTSKHHQKFVIDNKDYQRRLHEIKHLIGS